MALLLRGKVQFKFCTYAWVNFRCRDILTIHIVHCSSSLLTIVIIINIPTSCISLDCRIFYIIVCCQSDACKSESVLCPIERQGLANIGQDMTPQLAPPPLHHSQPLFHLQHLLLCKYWQKVKLHLRESQYGSLQCLGSSPCMSHSNRKLDQLCFPLTHNSSQ